MLTEDEQHEPAAIRWRAADDRAHPNGDGGAPSDGDVAGADHTTPGLSPNGDTAADTRAAPTRATRLVTTCGRLARSAGAPITRIAERVAVRSRRAVRELARRGQRFATFTREYAAREQGGHFELSSVAAQLRRRWSFVVLVARTAVVLVHEVGTAVRARVRRSIVHLRTDGVVQLRQSGRRARRATRPLLTTLIVGGVVIGVLTAALIPSVLVFRHVATFQPNIDTLRTLSQRSTVYASDGSKLAALGLENRQPVTYTQIPRVLINAIVATEDRTFWTNSGVDVAGLTRALLENVSSGRVKQGGSTITEQLVKNRILNPHRDLKRKVTEAVLALRLNRRLSKQQILTEYLNTVYFGEGAYGVQSASERLFLTQDPGSPFARGKEPHELTLPEAALLAGVIANPLGYNPFTHPDQARARRHDVLDRMLREHYITAADVALADQAPLPSIPPAAPDLRPRDLWVGEVQSRLLADPRLGTTPHDRAARLLRGGLRVETTLDPVAQFRAQAAVNTILPNQPPFTAALVAIDPNSGYVRAMVGGPGFDHLQYNIATHPPGRQPGSTYKVVTLAAALEAGYSPNDTVDGTSPCVAAKAGFPIWLTTNAEPGGGQLSLRDATVNSVNCAYAHVIASLGPPAVVAMAHRLGITGPVPAYLPITLGAAEATPLEMATVVGTLADQGVRHDPQFIQRVVGPDGTVYIDNTHPAGQRVLDPAIAACETDILRGVIQRGTGTAAQLPGRDAAGKTGTTDDHGDAWFIGGTPQLAAAVWMGATTGRVPMHNVGGIEVFGGTYPARIWQAFMNTQLAGQASSGFPAGGSVCDRPGAPISDPGRAALPGFGAPTLSPRPGH